MTEAAGGEKERTGAKLKLQVSTETNQVNVEAARRERRVKLQTDYALAVMFSKGFGAKETEAAFKRVNQDASSKVDVVERRNAFRAAWASVWARGKFEEGYGSAQSFLAEAEAANDLEGVALALNRLGMVLCAQGSFDEASRLLEGALTSLSNLERQGEAPSDLIISRVLALNYLARVKVIKGDWRSGLALSEQKTALAVSSGHAPSLAIANNGDLLMSDISGDFGSALRSADALFELSKKSGMVFYQSVASLFALWARGSSSNPGTAAREFRAARAEYFDLGNRIFAPIFCKQLAELKSLAGDFDAALTEVDYGLEIAQETTEHWWDAESALPARRHLAQTKPRNSAPAEAAFLTAIAIAQQQKARCFEMRAALALAKLYQSTGRPAEAHAVLAPALEGFSPTAEFPEIGAALELMTAVDADTHS